MNKLEFIKEIESKEGYITHKEILTIFKDDDEIPEAVQELICHLPKESRDIEIHTGVQGMKELEKAIKNEQSFYDPLNFDYDEFEKVNK